MGEIKTHKDLDVWKEAMKLAKEVYRLTSGFPKEEIYGLTAQIRRSVVSIPSNIAEGAARNSDKEFVQFLYIALGSIAELETQLLLSKDLAFCQSTGADEDLDRIRKMIAGLIRHVKGRKTVTGKETVTG